LEEMEEGAAFCHGWLESMEIPAEDVRVRALEQRDRDDQSLEEAIGLLRGVALLDAWLSVMPVFDLYGIDDEEDHIDSMCATTMHEVFQTAADFGFRPHRFDESAACFAARHAIDTWEYVNWEWIYERCGGLDCFGGDVNEVCFLSRSIERRFFLETNPIRKAAIVLQRRWRALSSNPFTVVGNRVIKARFADLDSESNKRLRSAQSAA
jgi:hypothetical protein